MRQDVLEIPDTAQCSRRPQSDLTHAMENTLHNTLTTTTNQ